MEEEEEHEFADEFIDHGIDYGPLGNPQNMYKDTNTKNRPFPQSSSRSSGGLPPKSGQQNNNGVRMSRKQNVNYED